MQGNRERLFPKELFGNYIQLVEREAFLQAFGGSRGGASASCRETFMDYGRKVSGASPGRQRKVSGESLFAAATSFRRPNGDKRQSGGHRDSRQSGGHRDSRQPGEHRDSRQSGGHRDSQQSGEHRDLRQFGGTQHSGADRRPGPDTHPRSPGGVRVLDRVLNFRKSSGSSMGSSTQASDKNMLTTIPDMARRLPSSEDLEI